MLLVAISRSDAVGDVSVVVVVGAAAVGVAVRLFDCLFVCLPSTKSKSKVASIQFELCVSKIAKPRTDSAATPAPAPGHAHRI